MRLARTLMTSVLLAVAALSGGCQLFAYMVAQFAPPEKVKAITELPKGKTIVVWVYSEESLSWEPIKGMLTDQLNAQLVEHKIAAATVSHDRLLDALTNCKTPTISMEELKRKTGADLLLYVTVEGFSLRESEDTPLWAGQMKVSVRVVDLAENKKVWPTDQREYPVPAVNLPPVDSNSSTAGNKVAEALAIKTADTIAKLFYEYELPRNEHKEIKDSPTDH